MKSAKIASLAIFFLVSTAAAQNDSTGSEISMSRILQKADSVMHYQDSLFAKAKYRVREMAVFNEIDGKGRIKNSDTTIALVEKLGNEELARQIEYSTTRETGGKKENNQEVGFEFSLSDTNYNFSLSDVNDSSYMITVSPNGIPREGQAQGTMEIDRQAFFLRRMDFNVPDPQGALKEFATVVDYEPLEGGLVVIKEMRMRGYARALLGIFKVRFTGHIQFSDYQILQ